MSEPVLGATASRVARRLAGYLLRYQLLLVLMAACMFAYAMASVGRVWFAKVLLDIFSNDPTQLFVFGILGWCDNRDLLIALCLVASLNAVLVGVFGYLKGYLNWYVTARVMLDVQRDVGGHMLKQSLSFFDRRKIGDLISRVSNDIGVMGIVLQLVVDDLILQPMFLVSAIITCFLASWQLSLLVFLGMPIVLAPVIVMGNKLRRRARARQRVMGEMMQVLTQMFGGIRTVKAYHAEDYEWERFSRQNEEVFQKNMRVLRTRVLSKALTEFLNNIALPILIFIGGMAVLHEGLGLKASNLIAFIGGLSFMYAPIRHFAKAYNSVQESLAGADRVFEILDQQPEIVDHPGARELADIREGIRFHDVHFAYQGGEPVLRGVDVFAPKGRITALVGPSGVGKSTLLDLLPRFYEPQQGAVEIDGVDVRAYTRRSLMRHIAIVNQDPFLFHASIEENLRYAKADATPQELEQACRAAQIHEFIASLPEGYHTVVGERGSKLSGGQIQRLTIARALLRDAHILILDEATSSLDTENEAEVQRALESLMHDRTTLVIAHRLSTIVGAHQIVVLDAGRVSAVGRHEELLAHSPLYARLHRMQSGEG